MAFEDFPRWTVASVGKHLLTLAEGDSIETVIELVNTRTTAWESAASNVELTVDGPRLARKSKNSYNAEVDIFAVLSTIDNGTTAASDHMTAVGKIAKWLNGCIEVFNLGNEAGDDGTTKIGTLNPNNGETGIVPVNLKPTRTDDRLHSTLSGTFKATYKTN